MEDSNKPRGRKRFLDKTHKKKGGRGISPDWFFKIRKDKRVETMESAKREAKESKKATKDGCYD